MNYVFDIETGPQPEEVIAKYFDPNAVKTGNAGKEKASVKIEEERRKFFERAALEATTAEILAIGFRRADGVAKILDGPETDLLINFWNLFEAAKGRTNRLIGHYIKTFDLPMMIRRSWLTGVRVPTLLEKNRYWDHTFIDTAELWGCGKYQDNCGLNDAAMAFGYAGKNGDGAEFARLWKSDDPADRERARQYLLNDLEMSAVVAEGMGVL